MDVDIEECKCHRIPPTTALTPDVGVHDAKECIDINFLRPSSGAERVNEEPLHPEFTYALFGEEESIVGYKDPKITLNYRANDLHVNVEIKSKGKVDLATLLPDAEVKQADIKEVFDEHVPQGKVGPSVVS